MTIPDLINGAFELTGGVLCWLNVRRLLRDRRVQGVDWRVSGFFSAWSFWNLFYYPSLAQWASFTGGLLLVLANTTWVVLALRTLRWQRHMEHKMFDPDCGICKKALKKLRCHPGLRKAFEENCRLRVRLYRPATPCEGYACQCDICQGKGGGMLL